MHIDICLRSRQLKHLPNLFELFVKQNSKTFLFDLKQFSEITIVREHKRVWVVWPSEITPIIMDNMSDFDSHFSVYIHTDSDMCTRVRVPVNTSLRVFQWWPFTLTQVLYEYELPVNYWISFVRPVSEQKPARCKQRKICINLCHDAQFTFVLRHTGFISM